MLIFIFYSHLKMASERLKRRDLLALNFITKKCNIIVKCKCLFSTIKNYHFLFVCLFDVYHKGYEYH